MRNNTSTRNAGFGNSSSPSLNPSGKNYLLSIGIDKYIHLPNLYNAVKDAKEVVQVLLEKYQFEKTYVIELYDEKATKKNIYKKLRELTERVTSQDNVLIYFSGHGEYDKLAKEGYWIPVGAENGEESDYIPNSVIRKKLGVINSHHTFLMADSCFAGSLFAKGAGRNVGKRYEKDPSRWGLTAGRNEIVSDGKAGDNSPFAESLLYRLRNNTGALNVQELCAHVTEYVLANSKQTPIGEPLQIEGHKNGQFVFHMKKDEVADWKTAIATGTLQGYELFLAKYAEGQYATEARAKIANFKTEKEWDTIQALPDKTSSQIRTKSQRIHYFLKNNPKAAAVQAAEDLGELLHHKAEFVNNYDNLFALRKFARRDTPFKLDAEKRILELEPKWEQEVKEPIVVPPSSTPSKSKPKEKTVKKGILKKEPITSKNERVPSPSFLQKNAKYLILLCLFPFLIWGMTKMFYSSENSGKDDEQKEELNIDPPKPKISYGSFTDSRDGQSYKTIQLKDGKIWMAENLNYNTKESFCYKKSESNCRKYGRLYTWKSALKACPSGWHLPSDKEWWNMMSYYGKAYSSIKGNSAKGVGKTTYKNLMFEGDSKFAALLGGLRNSFGEFVNLGEGGYYWSASENGADGAWVYYFGKSYGGVYRYVVIKSDAYSCRCVKD